MLALKILLALGIAISLYIAGDSLPDGNEGIKIFINELTVFVLACFVGWQVIWNVKPALHTPLMSVTNAISGIIIIGGMLQISQTNNTTSVILGGAAILLAAINVVGGFLVTSRMLAMFRQ